MPPSYKIVSGICRPETPEGLEIYKGIQREINRAYDSLGKKLIRVGGRIGDDTRNGVNAILGTMFKTCSEVANRAAEIWGQLKSFANSRQLAIVADPEYILNLSPPSHYDPETRMVVHPTASLAGFPLWYLAIAAAGGYYYLYQTKGGKKTRKSLTGGF